MSCVAWFPSGFEACFVCDVVCEWSRVSLWSRSSVASKKVSFVVSSTRGRTLPSGAASEGFPGRYREALRNFWAPSGVSWGASGASQGGSWVLPEHLREALGSSRDALGSVSGCFWDVSGSLLGLRESVGSGQDAKVKIIVSFRNSLVFQAPGAPKASQNRPGVASRGLVERAKVASSVFRRVASRQSGSEAAETSGNQRNSVEPSGTQPRLEKS